MNNSDKIKQHIICITEDYKALKSEIGRRSELQRFALLAYGGVIVVILKFNEKINFSSFQILFIWLASSIAYLFYFSEDDFIQRLSKIINFNSWLLSHLLEHENKERSYFQSLETQFKFYIEELDKKQENITLKDVVFPSESLVIGKIISNRKNKKIIAETYNFFLIGLFGSIAINNNLLLCCCRLPIYFYFNYLERYYVFLESYYFFLFGFYLFDSKYMYKHKTMLSNSPF